MAVKEIIETECDECGSTEIGSIDKRRKYTLPLKWVHVRAVNWRGIELFARDLCPPCAKPLACK